MRQLVALSLVLLLITACGGGSGGGGVEPGATDNTDTEPPPTQDDAARAIEILEGCTLEQLTTMTQLAQILQEAANGGGTGPVPALGALTEFQLAPGLVIPYTLDLDADETVDATGTIALLDEQGQPTNPFSLATLIGILAGGAEALPDLLAQLPDNTIVKVTYTGTNLIVGSGELLVRYVTGVPAGVEGTFTIPGTTCTTTFSWDEVAVEDLQGEFADVLFDISVVSGTDTLAGTLATDGTSVATASLALNDGAFFDYEIDLEAGTVTQN